jgi:hypothetical protein
MLDSASATIAHTIYKIVSAMPEAQQKKILKNILQEYKSDNKPNAVTIKAIKSKAIKSNAKSIEDFFAELAK